MNNLRNLTIAIVPASAWVAAATAAGVPVFVAAPGGMLLVALAAGLSALINSSETDPA